MFTLNFPVKQDNFYDVVHFAPVGDQGEYMLVFHEQVMAFIKAQIKGRYGIVNNEAFFAYDPYPAFVSVWFEEFNDYMVFKMRWYSGS